MIVVKSPNEICAKRDLCVVMGFFLSVIKPFTNQYQSVFIICYLSIGITFFLYSIGNEIFNLLPTKIATSAFLLKVLVIFGLLSEDHVLLLPMPT